MTIELAFIIGIWIMLAAILIRGKR